MDQRSRDRNAALKRIHRRLFAELVRQRRQQAILRDHFLLAGVHQQKTARAICVLHLTGLEAGLAHKGCMLIAKHATHAQPGKAAHFHLTESVTAWADLRQHAARDLEVLQHLVIPAKRGEIHQLRTTCVGHIRTVHAAINTAREIPQEIRIDVAEQ